MKIFKLIILIALLPILSCQKKTIPQGLTAKVVENGTTNSVAVQIEIERNGGSNFTEIGVCFSKDSLPTTDDEKVLYEFKIGTSMSSANVNLIIDDLSLDTTYFIRAYAKNKIGIIYSNHISYATHLPSPIVYNSISQYDFIADNEGNLYKTIKIGNQTWMAENLKTKHFNNGDLISTQNQFPYLNDENIVDVYGRLYKYNVIEDSRGICPVGWHIPSKTEWAELLNFCGNNVYKLQENSTQHWSTTLTSMHNSTGFTAIPSGYYLSSTFGQINQQAEWWSSTIVNSSKVYDLDMYNGSFTWYEDLKESAFSIRCIKD